MPIMATLISYIYISTLTTYLDHSLSRPYIYSITHIFNPYIPPLGSNHVHLTPYMPPVGSYHVHLTPYMPPLGSYHGTLLRKALPSKLCIERFYMWWSQVIGSSYLLAFFSPLMVIHPSKINYFHFWSLITCCIIVFFPFIPCIFVVTSPICCSLRTLIISHRIMVMWRPIPWICFIIPSSSLVMLMLVFMSI